MNLIIEIQNDILKPSITLSSILRKSKILANNLENEDFKRWINSECDGYEWKDRETFEQFRHRIPNYRIAKAEVFASIATRFEVVQNISVQTRNLPDEAGLFWFEDGLATLETYLEYGNGYLMTQWHDSMVENYGKTFSNYPIIKVWKQVPTTFVHQITAIVRDRLLNFILELEKMYPQFSRKSDTEEIRVSQSRITYLVNNYITIEKGEGMSIFDQRGQNIHRDQHNTVNYGALPSTLTDTPLSELKALLKELDEALSEIPVDQREDAELVQECANEIVEEAAKQSPRKKKLEITGENLKKAAENLASVAPIAVKIAKTLMMIG